MTFGTNHIKPASRQRSGLCRLNFGNNLIPLLVGDSLARFSQRSQPHIKIAPQLDISAAPSHVGRDCNCPRHARIGNDFRLFSVKPCIENLMLDFALFQFGRQTLRLVNTDRANKNRLLA